MDTMFQADDDSTRKKATTRKKTPYIDQFGEDFTELAREGKLDPLIGREYEINRICQILSRRRKNNPIILGDPGVGKSAIVEGIAQRIADKQVPHTLLNKRIVSISMTDLVAGTKYRGDFEERMKMLVDELRLNTDVIIFIDEFHTIMGAGGVSSALDASNILKPALSRGQVQCIGATTLDEYREYIEDDGALMRRFQEVFVDPPSNEETLEIINRIKPKYEEHHAVIYTEEAIQACVRLAERYITSREMPDKAIDVLDEAGAKVHLIGVEVPKEIKAMEKSIEQYKLKKLEAVAAQDYEKAAEFRDKELSKKKEVDEKIKEWKKRMSVNRQKVTEKEVEETVASITGIPVAQMTKDEIKKVISLENELKSNIIGQDSAIQSLTRVIKRSRTGVTRGKKPIGSFMFIGGTGVGKTETVKALAEIYFGNRDNLIRIDMSEYMEKFSVSRLTGAPPGYVGYESGGQLTEAVRRKPYSVVLFDEIEKAHPDIFNTLLQVLDDGRLTDSLGRTVDFTNTIIVMTSNIGAKKIAQFGTGIGFKSQAKDLNRSFEVETIIKNELKNRFPPEFLNRVDEIVLFNQLEKDHIMQIVKLEVEDLIQHMEETGYQFKLNKSAYEFLIEKGWDKYFGARPLKRAIQTYVEDLISDNILDGTLKQNGPEFIIQHKKGDDKLSIKS